MADRRVAFITGAARGIGAETARTLARSGWSVILTDICADIEGLTYPMGTKAELDAVVGECGTNAMGIVADVRDQASLDEAVALGVEAFGGLDAALAGAGVVAGGTAAWDLSEQTWQTNTDINLSGVWRTAKATIPEMLKRVRPVELRYYLGSAHYRSINWGEFRQARADGDFANYGAEVQIGDFLLG